MFTYPRSATPRTVTVRPILAAPPVPPTSAHPYPVAYSVARKY